MLMNRNYVEARIAARPYFLMTTSKPWKEDMLGIRILTSTTVEWLLEGSWQECANSEHFCRFIGNKLLH
jgi:hypothetical protein